MSCTGILHKALSGSAGRRGLRRRLDIRKVDMTRWPATIVNSAKCLKHNLIDRRSFSLSYSGGLFRATTADGHRLRFRHNPYLALYEMFYGYMGGRTGTIKPGMTVIDVGACDGEFALYASR